MVFGIYRDRIGLLTHALTLALGLGGSFFQSTRAATADLNSSKGIQVTSQAKEVLSRLILRLEGCGGLLSRTDELQRLKLPTNLVNEDRLLQFLTTYPELDNLEIAENDLQIDTTRLDAQSLINFLSDLVFLSENPMTPMENQSSQLGNYLPKNESQQKLLDAARQLIAVDGGSGAGLVIFGGVGLGWGNPICLLHLQSNF